MRLRPVAMSARLAKSVRRTTGPWPIALVAGPDCGSNIAMAQTPDKRRVPRVVRILRFRPRLFTAAGIALGVNIALFAACPDWRPATKLLIGWDAGLSIYLILAMRMMTRAELSHIRSRATLQDEGAVALLFLPCLAAGVSVAAIFAELALAKVSDPYGVHSTLAIVTIALSWTFIHTLFAFHYAHDFYGEGERANGLIFPGKGKPDYWDFAYFSFVIGMTFQVSDVQVSNSLIRRLVWAHGALSFAFNTAILAVTVNLATNAI
jgi:uncharacterized membrane protein